MRFRILFSTYLAAMLCAPAALADEGSPGAGERTGTNDQISSFCARLDDAAAARREQLEQKIRHLEKRIASLPADRQAAAEARLREEAAKAMERLEVELRRAQAACSEAAERAREVREKKENHGRRVRECAHDKQEGDRNHGQRVRECAHEKRERLKERAKPKKPSSRG